MRLVIQRSKEASVSYDDVVNKIDNGLVVFLGITNGDSVEDIKYLVKKLINLRIFEDELNKMNYSIQDINKEVMIISQFTLYASTKDGNRPSFEKCMKYDQAKELYDLFINKFKEENISFVTGEFGSDMKVSLINDGPVTIIIDSKENL